MRCVNRKSKEFKYLAEHNDVDLLKLEQITHKYWLETGNEDAFPSDVYIQAQKGIGKYQEDSKAVRELWQKAFSESKEYSTLDELNTAKQEASKYFPEEAISYYKNYKGNFVLRIKEPVKEVNLTIKDVIGRYTLDQQELSDFGLVQAAMGITPTSPLESKPANQLSSQEVWQYMSAVLPLTKRTQIEYSPKGQDKQTYTVENGHIYNKENKEVYPINTPHKTHRNKILANLAIREGRAVVVTNPNNNEKYVVDNNKQITSVATGNIMQWDDNNGDRKRILTQAEIKFRERIAAAKEANNTITPQLLDYLQSIGIDIHNREEMTQYLKEHDNKAIQEAIFGIDRYYLNSEHLDIIPELQEVVKNNKYNKAGTDVVILNSDPQTIYLIDHSNQEEFEVHRKENRHGVGIRKIYKLDNLTEDDFKEIIRNIAPSYRYSEKRIRHILQNIGITEEYLHSFDLNAELRRIIDSNDEIYGKQGQGKSAGGYGSGRYNYNVRESGNRTKTGLGEEDEIQFSIDSTFIPPLPQGSTLIRDLYQADIEHDKTVQEMNRINTLLYRSRTYESSMETPNGEIEISQSLEGKDNDKFWISSGKSIFNRVNISIQANANKNLIGGSIIFPSANISNIETNYDTIDNPIKANHAGILKAVLEHFVNSGHKRPASEWLWYASGQWNGKSLGYKGNVDALSETLGIDVSPYFQFELSAPIDTVDNEGNHHKDYKERVIVDAEGLMKALPTLQNTEQFSEIEKAIVFNEENNMNYSLQRKGLINQYKALKEKEDRQWDEIQKIKEKIRKEAEEASGLPFYRTPQGEVYAFAAPNGNLYFDETVISSEHPIHEYTHLWDRVVAKNNPQLWQRGITLMKETSLWKEVEDDDNYGKKWKAIEGITESQLESLIASEVHSRLTGVNGEQLLNRIAKEKGSDKIVNKLKQWLLDFWKDLKATFSDWSQEDLDKLTLQDFIMMTIRDFADGFNPNTFKQVQQQSNLPGSEMKINIYAGTGENADLSNFAVRPFRIPEYFSVALGQYITGAVATFTGSDSYIFNTVEGAFQAIKAISTGEYEEPNYRELDVITLNKKGEELIKKLTTVSGSEARRIGRSIPMSKDDISYWNERSSFVMKGLLKLSFEQNPQALQRLLATGNATLTHTQDKGKWGTEFPRLLMEVRDELRGNNTLQQSQESSQQKYQGSFASKAEFYSGAAIGSDSYWGSEARALGINVKDYTGNDYRTLSQEWKNKIEKEYTEARQFLGKPTIPIKNASSNMDPGILTRRDMMQADKADAIFAIAEKITRPGESEWYKNKEYPNNTGHDNVQGGTSNAVARGIIRGIPVYVFDQSDNQWKVWDNNSKSFISTSEPTLTPHAATIGTRGINDAGRQAIKGILTKTLQQTQRVETVESTSSSATQEETQTPFEVNINPEHATLTEEQQQDINQQLDDFDKINQQVDALNENAILSSVEVIHIAELVFNAFSDMVTEIQNNKGRAQELFPSLGEDNFDYQSATRKEIINHIGIGKLLDGIKTKYFDTESMSDEVFSELTASDEQKINEVFNNWDGVLTFGTDIFSMNEGFGLRRNRKGGRYELTNGMHIGYESYNGWEDPDAVREEEDEQEHWQVEQKTIDILTSASELVRRAIHECYLMKNGEKVLKYGIPERVNPRKAIQSILTWTVGSQSLNEMVARLQAKVDTHPWIEQLVARLSDTSGNETDLQSQFFTTMCKSKQLYAKGVKEKNEYSVIPVNEHPASSDIREHVFGMVQAHAHPLFQGENNRISESYLGKADKVSTNDEMSLHRALYELKQLQEAHKNDRDDEQLNEIEKKLTKDLISSVCKIIGFEPQEEILDEVVAKKSDVIGFGRYENGDGTKSMLDALQFIVNNLDNARKAQLSNKLEKYEPLTYGAKYNIGGDIANFLRPITDIMDETVPNVVFSDGKLYQGYTTPSYLTLLIEKFHWDNNKFNEFIAKEYKKSEWFFDKNGRARTPWLNLLTNPNDQRFELKHKVELSFNKHAYMKRMTPEEYNISIIANYFSEYNPDNNEKNPLMWFKMPIMSNKPSSEFLRFYAEMGSDYKDNITKGLFQVYLQELSRIQTVGMRNLSKNDPDFIKNWDKNGAKFCFLPFLNSYLKGAKIGDYLQGDENNRLATLLQTVVDRKELSVDDQAELNKLVLNAIKEATDRKCKSILNEWTRTGITEEAKKIKNILPKEYKDGKGEGAEAARTAYIKEKYKYS